MFRSSIIVCTFLTFGSAKINNTSIVIKIKPTLTAVAADHCQFLSRILKIAHVAKIGALIITCKPVATVLSIWFVSLVALVIKLAVENLLISAIEKDVTLLNNFSLIVFAKLTAILAAKKPTTIADIALASAIAIIIKPCSQTAPTVPPGCVISSVISFMYSGSFKSKNTCATINNKLSSTSAQSFNLKYLKSLIIVLVSFICFIYIYYFIVLFSFIILLFYLYFCSIIFCSIKKAYY